MKKKKLKKKIRELEKLLYDRENYPCLKETSDKEGELSITGEVLDKFEFFLLNFFSNGYELSSKGVSLNNSTDSVNFDLYNNGDRDSMYIMFDEKNVTRINISGESGNNTNLSGGSSPSPIKLNNRSGYFNKDIKLSSFSEGFLSKLHDQIFQYQKSFNKNWLNTSVDNFMVFSDLSREYNINKVTN